MTFIRTESGLANYKHFFNAEILFYIEGRCESKTPIEDYSRADSKFYKSLSKEFLGHENIKIKLVGNRKNALDYLETINAKNTPSSYVWIDKDYQDLTFSQFPKSCNRLMTTYGYSWENDLWTTALCLDLVSTITGDQGPVRAIANQKLHIAIKRLSILSSLNAAAHIDGRSIFKGKGKSKGINLNMNAFSPITKSEFSRIKNNAFQNEMCYVMRSVFSTAKTRPGCHTIQGHLLEHVCLCIISHLFKTSTGTSLKNNEILKNIALSKLYEAPKKYLQSNTYQHYHSEFSKIA